MSAYLISIVDVPDPKRYDVYKRDLANIIARHGGEYVVRGGEITPFSTIPITSRCASCANSSVRVK